MFSQWVHSGDGCALYAIAAGNTSAPAILFIHGVGVASNWWVRQFEPLSRDYFCVAFDLRGHGLSEKPHEMAAYQESKRWADDIAAVMSAFQLDKPALVCWSYGGLVLGDYLRVYGQEKLSRLILIDTVVQSHLDEALPLVDPRAFAVLHTFFSPNAITYRHGLFENVASLTEKKIYAHDLLSFHGAALQVAPETWHAMFDRQIDNSDVFAQVTLPTLIVYGTRDRIYTPLSTQQLMDVLPHARSVLFDCGHAPFYEDAVHFNRELIQFLE